MSNLAKLPKVQEKNELLDLMKRAEKGDFSELLDLTKRAERGDFSALPTLRELLKLPGAVDLFGGDLAREAQLTLINKFSGKNLLFRESLTRKLELMRDDLAGSKPTPIERLLVERVVACWLHLHHLEAIYARLESMALAQGAYYQHCLSAAQKRYLAAIKALAVVRKLAIPALQVNIADKTSEGGRRAYAAHLNGRQPANSPA